jgi:ABC-type polysaccharide/polyol phosphate transport system ATPase subunit
MESKLALRLDNVKKRYRLGVIGGGTLQGDIQSWWARIRGKEDPNTKIGTNIDTKKGSFMALDGISFDVKKGERLGIIGGNGAGKSTTLKILSRVTAPTEGAVYINGRISSMLEVGTGFHPELTGRENIYLNGAILGMSREEVDRKLDNIIDFSECRQFIDTPVKRYSSGMYVKLAFAVAAHLDSEILIMDEVLAVGDMKFQQKCLKKMQDVAENEGRTVLYVSHNMNTIRQLCDRCVVLEKGKLIFDGDVEKAIEIYMHQNEDFRLSYEYSNVKRSINESRRLQLTGIDFLNRIKTQIKKGEKLELKIHCKINEDISNVGIRFEIFYLDQTIAGTMFSNNMVSGKKGEQIDIVADMETKHFAPGKYKVVALAYERDNYGNQVGVDRVEPAMYFEIIEESIDEILWLHQYWGHVQFDDLEIKQIVKNGEK